jgi:hypothetical protein
VIGRSGRTEQFRENQLERIRPDLITLHRWMQFVALIHHSVKESPIRVCQSIVHVQESSLFPIRESRDVVVNVIDRGDRRHVVVARKDGRQHNRRVGCLSTAEVEDRLDASRRVLNDVRASWLSPDVIRSGQYDDNLWRDPIEFAILESPENILGAIRAPSKICGIPSEEIRGPVSEKFWIVGRAPAADNGITYEIDVDAALASFIEEFDMCGL